MPKGNQYQIKRGYVCECGHVYSPRFYQQIKDERCANPQCNTPLVNCTLESGEFTAYSSAVYYDDTRGTIYKDWYDL